MNDEFDNNDPLDALLAARPVEPSRDFADRVLARMRDDDVMDTALDEHLSAQPLVASPEFTDQVMSAIEAESSHKVLGFPSWVVALGSIAALLVAGMLAFVMLFQKGASDAQQRISQGITAVEPAPVEVAAIEIVPEPATSAIAEVPATATLAGMSEWEELLVMQDALADIADLSDQSDWQTVALLAN